MYVCVCVCVTVEERETDKDGAAGVGRQRETVLPQGAALSLCCMLSASELWMENRVEDRLRRN